MSDSDKVTITLKADGGAPWIVVHAATAEESHGILDGIIGGAQSIAEHAALAADVFAKVWAEQKQSNPVEAVRRNVGEPSHATQAREAFASAAPQGEIYTCVHGERVFRESSPPGKWAAQFCPTEKGTPGQCEPLWRNKKTGKFE